MVSPICLDQMLGPVPRIYITWIFVVVVFFPFLHMSEWRMITSIQIRFERIPNVYRHGDKNKRRTHLIADKLTNYMRSCENTTKTQIVYWTKWLGYIFSQKRLNSEFNYPTFSPVAFDSYAIICQKWMDLFIKNDEMQMNMSISFSLSTWHHNPTLAHEI